MNFKKILFGTATLSVMFITIFSLSSCCENDDSKAERAVETITEIETVKKTREELIINRTVMTIANQDSISDFENKHTPNITFGGMDEKGYVVVNVLVGSAGIVHPSTEEHWIDYMTLFINDEEYKHIEIEKGEGSNEQEFFAPLKNGDIVKVVLGCNLHGIWESSVHFE